MLLNLPRSDTHSEVKIHVIGPGLDSTMTLDDSHESIEVRDDVALVTFQFVARSGEPEGDPDILFIAAGLPPVNQEGPATVSDLNDIASQLSDVFAEDVFQEAADANALSQLATDGGNDVEVKEPDVAPAGEPAGERPEPAASDGSPSVAVVEGVIAAEAAPVQVEVVAGDPVIVEVKVDVPAVASDITVSEEVKVEVVKPAVKVEHRRPRK